MTVKSSVSLTDQQDAFVRSLVEQGRFPSVSAVIQNGIDLLRQKTEGEDADIEALRMILAERKAGAFISNAEMQTRLATMIARKRRD